MYPIKEKPKIYVFGWIGRIDRISRISYDLIQSYVRSYHFYDPSAILNVLVRWDCKIVRSYDLDRNFNNHVYDTFDLRVKDLTFPHFYRVWLLSSVLWHWIYYDHDMWLKIDTYHDHNGSNTLKALDRNRAPFYLT